jgi:hypothetical protein
MLSVLIRLSTCSIRGGYFPANPFGLKVSVVAEPNPLSPFQLAVVIPELKFSRTLEYPNEIVKRKKKK